MHSEPVTSSPQGLRVLVCGGRDFDDRELMERVLTRIDAEHPISVIIEGGGRGADHLAFSIASVGNRWGTSTYDADWETHGRAAGPMRNQRMLDEGKPDLVVAFPGGRGTANMVKLALKAGVRVIEVGPDFIFDDAAKHQIALATRARGGLAR